MLYIEPAHNKLDLLLNTHFMLQYYVNVLNRTIYFVTTSAFGLTLIATFNPTEQLAAAQYKAHRWICCRVAGQNCEDTTTRSACNLNNADKDQIRQNRYTRTKTKKGARRSVISSHQNCVAKHHQY